MIMGEDPRSTFRFLSGQQVLSLKELVPRQALDVVPSKRSPTEDTDTALIYIFVSHRWEKPERPDESGKQLKTLQEWLVLVEELVLAMTKTDNVSPLSWPRKLEDMAEGMPQAASLVARIRETALQKPKYREMLQNPLNHIYLWYDCACLPQKYPVERTPPEKEEFGAALGCLDWLVSQCELLCLRTPGDDYEQRAWCAFEHFQKSLYKFEGDITLDCEKFLSKTKVEWFVHEPVQQQQEISTELSPDISRPQWFTRMLQSMQQNSESATNVTAESRRIWFKHWQDRWKRYVADERVAKKEGMRHVPDLCEARYHIRRQRSKALETPPMQKAMEQLSRELHSAVYSMSCRDAAHLARVPVPAYFDACIPDVGIECGLHSPTTPVQRRRLQQLIDSGAANLISDDEKQVPAKVNNRGNEVLCERRVTIDLYQLARSMLSRFGLGCTNDGDVALVGFLALKNFLTKDQEKGLKLKLSAGALCHLGGLIQSAAETLGMQLPRNTAVSAFLVTVMIKAPRWVLLDLANAPAYLESNLLDSEALSLGRRAEKYLEDNPDCVSWSFAMHEDPPRTLCLHYCSAIPTCHASWAPCQHSFFEQQREHGVSMLSVSSTLDPWETADLPFPLALFGCVVANDRIFVIGGATGEEDPTTQTYSTCSARTFECQLLLTTETRSELAWSTTGDLISARRNHAACAIKSEEGKATTIAVSGGRSTTATGQEARLLSSIELLSLENDRHEWEAGPTMPCARASHHMVALSGSLFVFGGVVEDPNQGKDCDIYNIRLGMWLEGPRLPRSLLGGDSILIHDRFVILFGGSSDETPQSRSLVLDLQPWADWCAQGGRAEQRPLSVNWVRGPDIGAPLICPNICWAPASDTGCQEDWILSVSPLSLGNACWGMHLDASIFGTDPSFWLNLKWQQLGATPEQTAMGHVTVVKDFLVIMGGRNAGNVTSNSVHFRRLSTSHVMPLPASVKRDAYGKDIIKHHRILLNDLYLTGRLGFPLKEAELFAPDGTKKVSLLPPPFDPSKDTNRHCQRCILLTQSSEFARQCSDTTMYVVRTEASSKPVALCSTCLCSLYL